WPGAAQIVDAIARDLRRPDHVVVVAGIAATGARQLVDGAVTRWQLEQVASHREATRVIAGSLDEVALAVGADRPRGERGWLELVARKARGAAALVVFELADDPRADALVAALSRQSRQSPNAAPRDGARVLEAPDEHPVVAICDRAPAPRAGVLVHPAPLLDAPGVAQVATAMIGSEPPRAGGEQLRAARGGVAAPARR